MFIEPKAQRTLKLRRSEILALLKSTLRSRGAKELHQRTWAINIWPLCGQDTIFCDTANSCFFFTSCSLDHAICSFRNMYPALRCLSDIDFPEFAGSAATQTVSRAPGAADSCAPARSCRCLSPTAHALERMQRKLMPR